MGPITGPMVDNYGFPNTTIGFFVANLILLILHIVKFFISIGKTSIKAKEKDLETTLLLESQKEEKQLYFPN